MTNGKSDRDEKLADALRANLRRRKEQARTRSRPDDEEGQSRTCSTAARSD